MKTTQLLLPFEQAEQNAPTDAVSRMQAGKLAMAERCEKAAWTIFRQAGVGIIDFHSGGLHGHANYKTGYVSVPRPRTRRALQVAAHEAAHVFHKHGGEKPVHRQEYEAEIWSFTALREQEIAVPRKSVVRAKRYVAWKIRQAVVRGAKEICREAYRWCADYAAVEVTEAVDDGRVALTTKWQ